MQDPEYILQLGLTELAASDLLKNTALAMGFENLGEMLQVKIVDMQHLEGFTFRWLEEYMQVLERYGFLDRV
jgi:hypothetical protein